MAVDATEALDLLRQSAFDKTLGPVMERLGVRLLGAFGSATRRGASPRDLDVAVQFEGPPRLLELIDVLVEITGYDRIDIAVVEGDHPVLDAEALSGVPLYENSPGVFANAQMAALGHRRDTEWIRKLDLRRMAG
ncbi:MAG: hypothetical protein WBA45_14430 [Microthrixaceae bacterium]